MLGLMRRVVFSWGRGGIRCKIWGSNVGVLFMGGEGRVGRVAQLHTYQGEYSEHRICP